MDARVNENRSGEEFVEVGIDEDASVEGLILQRLARAHSPSDLLRISRHDVSSAMAWSIRCILLFEEPADVGGCGAGWLIVVSRSTKLLESGTAYGFNQRTITDNVGEETT